MAELDRRRRDGAWLDEISFTGGELVVELGGEVDLATVGPLEEQLEAALRRQPASLVLELRDLRFIDSSGIAMLIYAAQRVPRIELRYPSAPIRRVIELAGLTNTLPITS